MDDLDWQRHYAKLALRLNRHLGDGALVYHGPTSWQEDVRAEEPRSPAALVDDAEALLDACDGSPFRRAHVEAMRAVARFLTDERFPFPELARAVIGMEPRWVPEARFEQAHAWLADALPATSGTLAERMRAWQEASTLRTPERIPTLVDAAVAECRARTRRLVDLPPDDEVACVVVPQAHFHLAGLYQGGSRSTVYVNGGVPFSVADLLYNVAHEAHPGHIAETRLKVSAATTVDARVRFLYAPSLALGEGLGLAAEEIVFPDDEAQDWLAAHVFPEFAPELLAGRRLRPGALAAIHRAKNVLWGVWGTPRSWPPKAGPTTRSPRTSRGGRCTTTRSSPSWCPR